MIAFMIVRRWLGGATQTGWTGLKICPGSMRETNSGSGLSLTWVATRQPQSEPNQRVFHWVRVQFVLSPNEIGLGGLPVTRLLVQDSSIINHVLKLPVTTNKREKDTEIDDTTQNSTLMEQKTDELPTLVNWWVTQKQQTTHPFQHTIPHMLHTSMHVYLQEEICLKTTIWR